MTSGTAPLSADAGGLVVDWCEWQAARYAVRRWHYSRSMPGASPATLGVWEERRFVGAVVFGRGATPEIGAPFALPQTQVCELVRVALREHNAPVSQIVSRSLRLLRAHAPDLRLVVSFADTAHGHHGGIYQAGNWLYLGAWAQHAYRVNGTTVHPRTLYSRYGKGGQSVPWLKANVDPRAERLVTSVKHKYVWPFDRALRRSLRPLCQPYPAAEA